MPFEMIVIINGREVARRYPTLKAMKQDYRARYQQFGIEAYFTKRDENNRIVKDYFINK